MNLYVVVEGRRTEPRLYRSWLPQLLPGYQEIPRVEDALDDTEGDTFFLVAGLGYPSYRKRIHNAIRDCRDVGKPFHLVVSVDSEDVSLLERTREIEVLIEETLQAENISDLPSTVVVADCCIETWLLGNAKIIKRSPQSALLRDCILHYNVVTQDPEKMPQRPCDRTRADTHLKYLKEAFRERGISYTKRHPGDAEEEHYLKEIVSRARKDQPDGNRHLVSFSRLLELIDDLK